MNNTSYLQQLSLKLRKLHKTLINISKEEYIAAASLSREPQNQAEISPLSMLKLLSNNEHFEWLQCLSILVVEIDELRSEKREINHEWVTAISSSVAELILETTAQSHCKAKVFNQQYISALQHSSLLINQHADLKRLLNTKLSPPIGM